MNVNFYVTCIADVVKSGVAKNTVLLLEKLGCNVIFLEKQGCCGQPALNSGYTKQAIPGMKNLVETFEVNDYPIVAPAGSCVYAIKNYPDYFTKAGELGWAERAKKVVARFCDLTDFIVNKLGVTDVGAYLPGKAVYHPSCSLTRKLGIVDEPIALLKGVKGLDLSTTPACLAKVSAKAPIPIEGSKHRLICRFVEASASEMAETIRVSV